MNFRGILSKSSLKSSSSGKSLPQSAEVSKLQTEIESLKQIIDSLKVSVESRESAIGTLAREKEKIYVELKSAQRTNRNLHQQLVDERDIHSKEKDFLINEIKRLSKQNEFEMKGQQNEDGQADQNKQFIDDIKAKDEVIYNIGAKFMKIKSSKVALQRKFEKLQIQNKKHERGEVFCGFMDLEKIFDNIVRKTLWDLLPGYGVSGSLLQTCEKIIYLLQDNRKALDTLLDNLLKTSTVSPNTKKYLNLLQINANLHYENTQLKIYQSVKDSSKIQDEEINNRQEQSNIADKMEQTENKHAKLVATSEERSNSNVKMLPGCRRLINCKSKFCTNHDSPEDYNFKHVHRIFSSNIRSCLYRTVSDSCVARKDISELLNY